MKPKQKTNVTDNADAANDAHVYESEIIQELRRTNDLLAELLNRTPKRISGTDLVN